MAKKKKKKKAPALRPSKKKAKKKVKKAVAQKGKAKKQASSAKKKKKTIASKKKSAKKVSKVAKKNKKKVSSKKSKAIKKSKEVGVKKTKKVTKKTKKMVSVKAKAKETVSGKVAKTKPSLKKVEVEPILSKSFEELKEDFLLEMRRENVDSDVVLTDAEGRRLCKVPDCDQAAMVEDYCRYHYLLYWKKIQVRKRILADGKLRRYIEELTLRYPDKYLEMLRKDLRGEKEFLSAIQEMDIDERANETDYEDDDNFIEEIRGVSAESSSRSEDDY